MARRQLCGRPTHDGTPCRNSAGCSVNHGTQRPISDSAAAKQAAAAANQQSSTDAAASPRRPPTSLAETQALIDRLPVGPAESARQLAHEQAKIFGEWPEVMVRARHIRTGPREHIDRVLDGFTVFVRNYRGEYKPIVETGITDGKEHERAAAGDEWEKEQAESADSLQSPAENSAIIRCSGKDNGGDLMQCRLCGQCRDSECPCYIEHN